MAEVELVIKIPEEQYNTIKSDLYNTFPAEMKKWGLDAIRNGIPLPKGHDRLVEANEVVKALFNHKTIYDVQTIIEADHSTPVKEESKNKDDDLER